MNITLKMTIQDQKIELNANLTNNAGRIYRQQFCRDLLRDMTELYKKLHKSPFEGIDMTGIDVNGKTEQEIYQQLVSKVDISKLIDSKESLDFEETEKGEQIIWAFLKNADQATPNFTDWSNSYDYVLPVGDIVSALFEAWSNSAQTTVELKN